MKTIKSLKDITTLEVGDKVVFGNLVHKVRQNSATNGYYLYLNDEDTPNDTIFNHLKVNKRTFIENIGIRACIHMDFPETKSLEALTAIVSALFKEYEKQNELPKTWEEFCKRNPIQDVKYYISVTSDIEEIHDNMERNAKLDRNVCNSKQEAEAFLALMQLYQLRKAYVKDWEPDYKQQYYGIIFNIHGLDILPYTLVHKSMSFPTHELAKQFLTNFKDLLEVAKQLL